MHVCLCPCKCNVFKVIISKLDTSSTTLRSLKVDQGGDTSETYLFIFGCMLRWINRTFPRVDEHSAFYGLFSCEKYHLRVMFIDFPMISPLKTPYVGDHWVSLASTLSWHRSVSPPAGRRIKCQSWNGLTQLTDNMDIYIYIYLSIFLSI